MYPYKFLGNNHCRFFAKNVGIKNRFPLMFGCIKTRMCSLMHDRSFALADVDLPQSKELKTAPCFDAPDLLT